MQTLTTHPKYIVNDKGKKTSVILPLKDYENLLQEIEDLADIAERRNDPVKEHSDFIAELKEDGYI